jgi:CheY-like chemotaxis protein
VAQQLDREIDKSTALVIDSNPTSRSLLAAQLREFGVGTVAQCSRIHDARKQLEIRTFDVVLCEQEFHGAGYTGQDLLDDLRRNQLLPLTTVFIIVTSEASYAKVADAAESALDSYLLKPHTAASLGDRLAQARHRKKVLADIFEAIEAQDFATATRLCLKRFTERGRYWLYAARMGSELLLRQGQHDAGKKLYEAVLETGALPWARLGIARAQIEGNQTNQALRTLESLIGDEPSYVDAYDVMGRMQVEQGDLTTALETYRKASSITPGSITRLQKHGMLAFYMGDREESAKMLDRAASLGISSKMFDLQSLVLLAFSRFHQRDTKGLQRCIDNLNHALEKAPQSKRLQRFVAVVSIFSLMLHKQVGAAVAGVREITSNLRDPGLDIEAACNILSMVAQLTGGELKLDGAEDWVDTLALRFASSKGMTELLARTASGHAPFSQRVHDCHTRINAMAEQAVTNSLQGNHRAAVLSLLQHGERTLNSKLIDMARMTLQRHHAKVPDAEALTEQIESLRTKFSIGAGVPSLGQGGGRQAGGLILRETGRAEPNKAAAATAKAGVAPAAPGASA